MIDLNLSKVYNFLASQNILQPKISKVAGDASFRSYYRVLDGDKSYILMFAPVGYEDPKPFIKISTFLQENNFCSKGFCLSGTRWFFVVARFW